MSLGPSTSKEAIKWAALMSPAFSKLSRDQLWPREEMLLWPRLMGRNFSSTLELS